MPRQPYVPLEESVYRPTEHKLSRRGVAPDLPIEDLHDNYLSSALNFLVRNGRVQKRDGYNALLSGGGTPNSFASAMTGLIEWVSPSNGPTLVAGGLGGIYGITSGSGGTFQVAGSISHDPTLSHSTFFTTMRTASSGFRIVHVNGKNLPSWWTGATGAAFATLTTSVIGACAIAWKSHLLMGDTTVATGDGALNVRINWSALGSPAIWSGTASAGSIDLTDANGSGVQNMLPLRTVLAVYKEEAVHSLIYKAAPFYFTQSILHPTLSTIGRRTVCSIDNGERHFVMTKEGAVIWDGQTVRQIGVDRVDKTILQSIVWAYRERCWAAWNPVDREILIGIVTTGTVPNRVWVYNLQYDSWWETDLPWLHAHPIYNFFNTPQVIASTNDSTRIWLGFQGAPGDTTAQSSLSCSLQTGLYDYGAFENKALFQIAATLSPGTGSSVTVSLSKASQANPLATPSFTSAQSITVTGSPHTQKVDFRRTERFIGYRLTEGASTDRLVVDRLIPYITERTNTRIGR